MKHTKRSKSTRTITTLIVIFLLSSPLFLLAQNPPHPNDGNVPGGANTPVGGEAPIGGGTICMLVLGAIYGTKKVYDFRRKVNE